MTIHPDGPGEAFYDKETIMTLKQIVVEKLKPGNQIPVRFHRTRQLVFPISPITVVGTRWKIELNLSLEEWSRSPLASGLRFRTRMRPG